MRSLRDNRLTLVTGLAAALPVLIATVDALAGGWLPLGDRAVIAVRSFDVLSTHPPLLGQYSSSSQILGEPVHSPGPLLYWLLALPVRVDRSAPALVMGVVNTAAVIASVALARRRGGVALMFATGAGLALMLASLDSSLPYDIWNPAAGLLPFTLLIFLVWSLACGEWRLLPLTALVASFAVQAHLAYALPAGALLVVAGCFLVGSGKPIPRRRLVATLAVLALCWIAPLAEELIHRPGNVERIVRSGLTDKPTLGAKAGRSEEHTSELQSHRDLHSFPTRRSSALLDRPAGGGADPPARQRRTDRALGPDGQAHAGSEGRPERRAARRRYAALVAARPAHALRAGRRRELLPARRHHGRRALRPARARRPHRARTGTAAARPGGGGRAGPGDDARARRGDRFHAHHGHPVRLRRLLALVGFPRRHVRLAGAGLAGGAAAAATAEPGLGAQPWAGGGRRGRGNGGRPLGGGRRRAGSPRGGVEARGQAPRRPTPRGAAGHAPGDGPEDHARLRAPGRRRADPAPARPAPAVVIAGGRNSIRPAAPPP